MPRKDQKGELIVSYKEVKNWVQKFNLHKKTQWEELTNSDVFPKKFPKAIDDYFKKRKKWKGWGDFLGYDKDRNYNYVTYEEAQEILQKNNIKSQRDMKKFSRQYNKKNKLKIPTNPNCVYKKQWVGTRKYLKLGEKWLSFEEAKKFIKGKFETRSDYYEYRKSKQKHKKIPFSPDGVYKRQKKWKGWGDFLGTGYVSTQRRKTTGYYLPYNKARKFARSLHLSGQREWENWNRKNKRPHGMPMSCSTVYEKEWTGWADFLGYKGKQKFCKEVWSYEKARKWIKKQNLRTELDFKRIKKKKGWLPDGMKLDPESYYRSKGVWKGWNYFLGQKKNRCISKNRVFRTYIQSKKWVQRNKINSHSKFVKAKKPFNIPTNPNKVYKNKGWKSWKAFFGIEEYLSCIGAKRYLRKLKLRSYQHYRELYSKGKIPKTIPMNLWQHYKKDKHFKSMADMLGTVSKDRKYWNYNKARKFVQDNKIAFVGEYKEIITKIPQLPYYPENIYEEWEDWEEFLYRIQFLSYNEASTWAKKNKIETNLEWREFVKQKKIPINIPNNPELFYRRRT